jgi:hypothetical protein
VADTITGADAAKVVLREWLDKAAETLPMLKVDRPDFEQGRHRARRKYLQRHTPAWRLALRALVRSVRSAPEATTVVVAVASLVGLAIGASS